MLMIICCVWSLRYHTDGGIYSRNVDLYSRNVGRAPELTPAREVIQKGVKEMQGEDRWGFLSLMKWIMSVSTCWTCPEDKSVHLYSKSSETLHTWWFDGRTHFKKYKVQTRFKWMCRIFRNCGVLAKCWETKLVSLLVSFAVSFDKRTHKFQGETLYDVIYMLVTEFCDGWRPNS